MKKRLLSLLLITTLILSAFLSVSVSTSAAQLYGDVDGDDDVTIIDVTQIQRFLAGINDPDADAQKRRDVDADDKNCRQKRPLSRRPKHRHRRPQKLLTR